MKLCQCSASRRLFRDFNNLFVYFSYYYETLGCSVGRPDGLFVGEWMHISVFWKYTCVGPFVGRFKVRIFSSGTLNSIVGFGHHTTTFKLMIGVCLGRFLGRPLRTYFQMRLWKYAIVGLFVGYRRTSPSVI